MSKIRAQGQQRSAVQVNAECYASMKPGMREYWTKMAGPRFRVATFLRLLDEGNPVSVVDLGCGNGQLLQEIARHCPETELCGIDLSEPQIHVNRSVLPRAAWYAMNLDGSVFLQNELAGRFEAVIASEIIEHLDHPEIFLQNARALAKMGTGYLFLSTQSGIIRETERQVGHQRHFSAREMRELLQSTGWEPVKIWNCGFPFHDLSKWAANLSPSRAMHRFGEGTYGWFENLTCTLLRFAFCFNSNRVGAQLFAIAKQSANPHKT